MIIILKCATGSKVVMGLEPRSSNFEGVHVWFSVAMHTSSQQGYIRPQPHYYCTIKPHPKEPTARCGQDLLFLPGAMRVGRMHIIIILQQSRLTQTRVVSCYLRRLHDPANKARRFLLDVWVILDTTTSTAVACIHGKLLPPYSSTKSVRSNLACIPLNPCTYLPGPLQTFLRRIKGAAPVGSLSTNDNITL